MVCEVVCRGQWWGKGVKGGGGKGKDVQDSKGIKKG
jgi:hypothetical protein